MRHPCVADERTKEPNVSYPTPRIIHPKASTKLRLLDTPTQRLNSTDPWIFRSRQDRQTMSDDERDDGPGAAEAAAEGEEAPRTGQ